MVRPYSTPDALEGLLQLVRTDHNIAPNQEFRRLINLPGNRRAAAARCCGPCQLGLSVCMLSGLRALGIFHTLRTCSLLGPICVAAGMQAVVERDWKTVPAMHSACTLRWLPYRFALCCFMLPKSQAS